MSESIEAVVDAPPIALAAPPPAGESAWSAIREALHGSRRDYTEGPIGRAIFVLAVPMVLEMIMESVFAVCDVFFVSRLGADAIATVGLTETLLTTVYALAMGLAIGATAIVARRVGEHDGEGAARAAVQALILGLVLSIVLGVVGGWQGPRLLALMGADAGVIATGAHYTRMMLGGCASIVLLFLVNAVFRGAGDAAISMRALWLANGINILLGPCLIFGLGPFPRMGVLGAAVATTIGRSTGALYAMSRLANGGRHLRVAVRHLRIELATMVKMLRLSGSGALQAFIGSGSWVALVRILSTFGAPAIAGYTIGIRVVMFALLPSWGLSNAGATMVGQALGAKKPERAEQAVWSTSRYNVAFLGGVGLLIVLLAPRIAAIFTSDPLVAPFAVNSLRVMASGFAFYAYGMVLTAAFNGAGDTRTPTLLNLAAFWALEQPVAWFLAFRLGWGATGVFASVPIAFLLFAGIAAVLFRRGEWKLKSI